MLGILSATALPKFFEKNTFAERAFFDDTLNALRYAQKLAVATHCDVRFSFESNEYKLKRPASIDDCGVSITSFPLNVIHPSTGNIYSGSEAGINTSTVSIVFYANGSASLDPIDSSVTVGSKNIEVVAKTGFVYAE